MIIFINGTEHKFKVEGIEKIMESTVGYRSVWKGIIPLQLKGFGKKRKIFSYVFGAVSNAVAEEGYSNFMYDIAIVQPLKDSTRIQLLKRNHLSNGYKRNSPQ